MSNDKRSRAKRLRLLLIKHNWKCYLCGVLVNHIKKNAANSATIDHIIPLSKGGKNVLSNLALACRRCNMKKGSKVDMFRNDVQRCLVIKTLLGVVNAAHWWTEMGPTEEGVAALNSIQVGGRGPFSTSGNDILKIAMSLWDPTIGYNLFEMMKLFDSANRILVSSLVNDVSMSNSGWIDSWLETNQELRAKEGLKNG